MGRDVGKYLVFLLYTQHADNLVWYLLLLSIPVLVLFHLSVAPYTKVEESFHIQAVHDLLHSGIPTRNVADTLRSEYDHFSFPGAVPRTFVGAVALSGLSRPWIALKAGIDRQWLGMPCSCHDLG